MGSASDAGKCLYARVEEKKHVSGYGPTLESKHEVMQDPKWLQNIIVALTEQKILQLGVVGELQRLRVTQFGSGMGLTLSTMIFGHF